MRGGVRTKEQKVWNERSHKASSIDITVISLMHYTRQSKR